ncbi:MAG: metallopeptidase family protein [Myxococcales bacterium]|nr:metallopeptidase family protein [Myxococcales bacterium]
MATPSRIIDALEDALDALIAGDLDEVERRMRLPRRKGARTPERLLIEARIAGTTDGPEAALSWIEKAHAADPGWCWPPLDASRAYLDLGRIDEARAQMALAIERIGADDAEAWSVAAGGLIDLGELAQAEAILARRVEADPDDADDWYVLGLVRHELGDRAGSTAAWIRARALDLEAPRPPWALPEPEIEAITQRTLDGLPDEVVARLADVPIFLEEAPSEEQVSDGLDPRALGLFSGTPLPLQEGGSTPELHQITLFLRNLEMSCDYAEELEDQVRITILHETAHFFGLEDDDLDAIGLG